MTAVPSKSDLRLAAVRVVPVEEVAPGIDFRVVGVPRHDEVEVAITVVVPPGAAAEVTFFFDDVAHGDFPEVVAAPRRPELEEHSGRERRNSR